MIKILVSSLLAAQSLATYMDKVFQLAETRNHPFTITAKYGRDDPVLWEIEFKDRDTLLGHRASQHGPLELISFDKSIIPYRFMNRIARRTVDQLHLAPRISMTLDSDFSRQVRLAVFVPRGDQHWLILNPEDPHKICPKESLEFLTVRPDNSMIATITLHNPISGELIIPVPARYHPTGLYISGDSQTSVPPYVFETLSEEVGKLGCSQEALSHLPIVKYSIDKLHVTKTAYENIFHYNKDQLEVIMKPADYVEEINGVCYFKIVPHPSRPAWGRNMISKFVFIIDYNGNRYGICRI